MHRLTERLTLVAAFAALAVAVAAPLPSSAAVTTVATATVREVRVSTVPTSALTRSWEPAVSADPLNAKRLAVAYAHGSGPIVPVIRISHDGGLTWRSTTGHPTGGGIHIVVAWGPGPHVGRSRLYYVNMVGSGGGVRLGTSYSDDEGTTWSRIRVQTDTPAWVGGTPDITVDTDPASPNYGVVYATYNWPRSATLGPGLHVLASADYGRTFQAVEVPALPAISGYPARHRIGYRLRAAHDGSLYVAWYQADLRYWRASDPLNKGAMSNIGRIRFGVARLVFNRRTHLWSRGPSVTAATLPRTQWNAGYVRPGGLTNDPQWSIGLAVDPLTGRVTMAVGADGTIRVYSSVDRGRTWTYRLVPHPPAVAGRAQWIAKPDLGIGRGFMVIGMRMFDQSGATSGHAYSLSTDGGIHWSRPKAVSGVRWAAARVSTAINGVGLRNRLAVTADGTHVVFVYGDGRYGVYGANRAAIFGARITVTVPTPAAAPAVTPGYARAGVTPGYARAGVTPS